MSRRLPSKASGQFRELPPRSVFELTQDEEPRCRWGLFTPASLVLHGVEPRGSCFHRKQRAYVWPSVAQFYSVGNKSVKGPHASSGFRLEYAHC